MSSHIARWGHSLAVRIPKTVAEKAKLRAGTAVEVSVSGDNVVISARPPTYRLDALVRKITPRNRHAETDWGGPIGRELW